MSDLERQAIIQNAEGYPEESIKVFLSTVSYELLAEEVKKRMEKLENLQKKGKELFNE